MSTTRARVFEFAASIGPDGSIKAQGESAPVPTSWTPEDLLLAGLLRCSLASLRFHAGRARLELEAASARASGKVTRREEDGRFAFVEIECLLDVRLAPEPEDTPALLAKAERDCFVGASLAVKPVYRWRVNGTDVG